MSENAASYQDLKPLSPDLPTILCRRVGYVNMKVSCDPWLELRCISPRCNARQLGSNSGLNSNSKKKGSLYDCQCDFRIFVDAITNAGYIYEREKQVVGNSAPRKGEQTPMLKCKKENRR